MVFDYYGQTHHKDLTTPTIVLLNFTKLSPQRMQNLSGLCSVLDPEFAAL